MVHSVAKGRRQAGTCGRGGAATHDGRRPGPVSTGLAALPPWPTSSKRRDGEAASDTLVLACLLAWQHHRFSRRPTPRSNPLHARRREPAGQLGLHRRAQQSDSRHVVLLVTSVRRCVGASAAKSHLREGRAGQSQMASKTLGFAAQLQPYKVLRARRGGAVAVRGCVRACAFGGRCWTARPPPRAPQPCLAADTGGVVAGHVCQRGHQQPLPQPFRAGGGGHAEERDAAPGPQLRPPAGQLARRHCGHRAG